MYWLLVDVVTLVKDYLRSRMVTCAIQLLMSLKRYNW